jgi:hypothetical protein
MPDLTWWLTLGWLAVGGAVGGLLTVRGHAQEAALAALVAWPFFLPALARRPALSVRQGPNAPRIRRTLDAVRQALEDAGVATDSALCDLDGVGDALHEADGRIQRVDQLLDEALSEDAGVAEERLALAHARDDAMADLESVLAGLAQLRLQVGRLALAGDAGPITQHLRELRARVAALDELREGAPTP